MKKLLILCAIIFSINMSIAQNFKQLASYEFTAEESYKTEEGKVLLCANYLLNYPANTAELNRLTSLQYIMKWMMGTPDHTFDIGDKSMELTKGNQDLLGLYMAAMSKVVIDNKGEKLSADEIYNQAEKLLVDYCADAKNKMKPSKKIKKIIKNRKS